MELDIDPMLFMQSMVDEQLEMLDMFKTGAGMFGPGLASIGEGVVGIARQQVERAQLALDTLIAEDGTWSSSEWCAMVYDGNDPEDGDYYRCTVHGRLVLGDAYVCEGYEPPPYTGGH